MLYFFKYVFEFSSQKRLKLLPWLSSLLDLSWIVKAIISSEALIELFKSWSDWKSVLITKQKCLGSCRYNNQEEEYILQRWFATSSHAEGPRWTCFMTSHAAAFYTKRNLNATQESNTEKVPYSFGLIGILYFYSDCANYSYT